MNPVEAPTRTHSKKIILEVTPLLHRRLKLSAMDNETTMAAIIRTAIEKHLDEAYAEQGAA